MPIIKVPKSVAEEYDWPYNCIEDTIVDNSRWSIIHQVILEYQGKFYRASYSVGATEYQDELPWGCDKEIVLTEVHKVSKTIEVWEPTPDASGDRVDVC